MKIEVDYDPIGGNISANGMIYYIGPNLVFPTPNNDCGNVTQESEVVKLSNNGMTADDLVKLRESGVI